MLEAKYQERSENVKMNFCFWQILSCGTYLHIKFFKGFLIIIHLKKKNQCISVKLKESARENKKTEKDYRL